MTPYAHKKNYMLYIMGTLDVLNPINSIVGSKITLSYCHAHSKSYLLEFRITKRSNDCRNEILQWAFSLSMTSFDGEPF
jgi:hypothetical protein